MRGLKLALGVAFVAAAGLTAFGKVGGSGENAPAVGPAPVLDEATQAKIEELYKKLDALAPAGDRGVWGYSVNPVQGAGGTDAAKQNEYREVYNEILSLSVGPELAGKNQEYTQKFNDLQKQQAEVWQDKGLDQNAKMQRWQEISKLIVALNAEYPEVVRVRSFAQTQVWQRQQRRGHLKQLKDLLKATDEEWKALDPKVEAVLRVQADLRSVRGTTGTFVMIPSPKWQNPPANTEGELVKTLKGDNPDKAIVTAKLEALRKTRTDEETKRKAQIEDLTKKLKPAQDALRELLTVRQEAVLVVEGILD